MDIYRDQIDRLVYEQKKLLEEYTEEYKLAAINGINGLNGRDEHLIRGKNNGRDNYYCAYHENGKYVRKCINNDQAAIKYLARKEYLRVAIESLKNNIELVEASCKGLIDLDFDAIKAHMLKAYRDLPEECFFLNESGRGMKLSENNEDRFARHREWANESYEKSSYKPEGRRFMTSAGFRVRSKSEQHIVEQLVNYGVPFRYEQVIHINEKSYSSDFVFRDRNLELLYWEHAGMMDDPGYVESYHRKMNAYRGIGIVPWKNLIITYDIDGGINIPMIKSIIENEVIPRL